MIQKMSNKITKFRTQLHTEIAMYPPLAQPQHSPQPKEWVPPPPPCCNCLLPSPLSSVRTLVWHFASLLQLNFQWEAATWIQTSRMDNIKAHSLGKSLLSNCSLAATTIDGTGDSESLLLWKLQQFTLLLSPPHQTQPVFSAQGVAVGQLLGLIVPGLAWTKMAGSWALPISRSGISCKCV